MGAPTGEALTKTTIWQPAGVKKKSKNIKIQQYQHGTTFESTALKIAKIAKISKHQNIKIL